MQSSNDSDGTHEQDTHEPTELDDTQAGETRRSVLSKTAACLSVGAAGVLGCMRVGEYLTPSRKRPSVETFLAFVDDVPDGSTLSATLPNGERIQVRRSGEEFAGFSDSCPHLGCRVYWMAPKSGENEPNKRAGWFRCPCHEGWFLPNGEAFSGPPAAAGQKLKRIDLIRRGSSLYVMVEGASA